MGADRTLVDAAFAEARSRAAAQVPDLTNLYKSSIAISRGYKDLIIGAMDEYKRKKEEHKVALDNQMKQFNTIMEENLQALYNEDQPMPDLFINSVEGKLKDLQAEFEKVNTLGKGDNVENQRTRRRITGDLNKVVSEIKAVRGTIQKMSVQAKDINKNRISMNTWAGLSILDLKNWNNNPNIKLDWNDEGKVTFTTSGYNGYGTNNADGTGDEITLTMKQLEEAFPFANYDFDTKYTENLTFTSDLAKGHGVKGTYDYKIDDQRAEFIDGLETDKDVENIVSRKIKNVRGISFEDALIENIDIPVTLLDNMFVDDGGVRTDIGQVFKTLDTDGDGFIEKEDMTLAKAMGEEVYATYEENLDDMIEAIVNVNHKAYNADRTKGLLADYFIGKKGEGNQEDIKGIDWQTYDDSYNTHRAAQEKIDNPSEGRDTFFVKGGPSWQEKQTLEDMVNSFKTNKPVEDWAGTTWNPIGNDYYQSTLEKDKKPVHKSILMRSPYFKLGGYMNRYHKDLYPAKIDETRNTPKITFENTFTGPDKNVTATSFVGADAKYVARVLNNHYNVKTFGVNKDGMVMVPAGGKYLKYHIRTKEEVRKLLETLSSIQKELQNTEYED